jgi:hypothetical protein
VTDPLPAFRASGQHHGFGAKAGGLMGFWSLIKTLTGAEYLVTVGPVGLEPTTYGLQIWLLAM